MFEAGGERYALDSSVVSEVVPLVNLRPIPHTPEYVGGMFQFKGRPVPVVDLHQLLAGTPCVLRMSTRILLAELGEQDGEKRLLGLMAERATQTMKAEAEDFQVSGMNVKDAPYLSGVHGSGADMVQLIDVAKVLPEELKSMLFTEAET